MTAVSHVISSQSFASQLIAVTNELIDVEHNLAECYVADRSVANSTFSASSWSSMKEADRAIERATEQIKADISRLSAQRGALIAKHATLLALLTAYPPTLGT